jgi:hypothetical protein
MRRLVSIAVCVAGALVAEFAYPAQCLLGGTSAVRDVRRRM